MFLVIHHTHWLNRILAAWALIYIICIFRKNDYIPNGLFDPKKLKVIDESGRLSYSGDVPVKFAEQVRQFEDVTFHLKTIMPKFKYKVNNETRNVQFMRVAYCPFSGKFDFDYHHL